MQFHLPGLQFLRSEFRRLLSRSLGPCSMRLQGYGCNQEQLAPIALVYVALVIGRRLLPQAETSTSMKYHSRMVRAKQILKTSILRYCPELISGVVLFLRFGAQVLAA